MLSREEFIKRSLELDLFFLRIMKEHAFFLEAGFPGKNSSLSRQAEQLKSEFTRLLTVATELAFGVLDEEVLFSGELVTPYTVQAERASEYYTGIGIDTQVTSMELSLDGEVAGFSDRKTLSNQVYSLNQRTIVTLNLIIAFKRQVLSDVLSCRIFTANYPLLIDHILREAMFYRQLLIKLQNGEEVHIQRDIIEQERFWNRIMAEHSKFIRGFLDPTEEALFEKANQFGKEFDELTQKSLELSQDIGQLSEVTQESLNATKDIREFKRQGTEGLVECRIKAIMVPLLGDHTLREASHYLRLLRSYSNV